MKPRNKLLKTGLLLVTLIAAGVASTRTPKAILENIKKQLRSDEVIEYVTERLKISAYPGIFGWAEDPSLDALIEINAKDWIRVGSSPRASIALDKCARASAWLAGRDYVTPDDVRGVAHPVLRHRLILSYDALAESVTADAVIDEILRLVAAA